MRHVHGFTKISTLALIACAAAGLAAIQHLQSYKALDPTMAHSPDPNDRHDADGDGDAPHVATTAPEVGNESTAVGETLDVAETALITLLQAAQRSGSPCDEPNVIVPGSTQANTVLSVIQHALRVANSADPARATEIVHVLEWYVEQRPCLLYALDALDPPAFELAQEVSGFDLDDEVAIRLGIVVARLTPKDQIAGLPGSLSSLAATARAINRGDLATEAEILETMAWEWLDEKHEALKRWDALLSTAPADEAQRFTIQLRRAFAHQAVGQTRECWLALDALLADEALSADQRATVELCRALRPDRPVSAIAADLVRIEAVYPGTWAGRNARLVLTSHPAAIAPDWLGLDGAPGPRPVISRCNAASFIAVDVDLFGSQALIGNFVITPEAGPPVEIRSALAHPLPRESEVTRIHESGLVIDRRQPRTLATKSHDTVRGPPSPCSNLDCNLPTDLGLCLGQPGGCDGSHHVVFVLDQSNSIAALNSDPNVESDSTRQLRGFETVRAISLACLSDPNWTPRDGSTCVSVVSFDRHSHVLLDTTPVDANSIGDIVACVGAYDPNLNSPSSEETNILCGLWAASVMLESSNACAQSVVLISDMGLSDDIEFFEACSCLASRGVALCGVRMGRSIEGLDEPNLPGFWNLEACLHETNGDTAAGEVRVGRHPRAQAACAECASRFSDRPDCDDDGVPDACEDDADENGIPDDCEGPPSPSIVIEVHRVPDSASLATSIGPSAWSLDANECVAFTFDASTSIPNHSPAGLRYAWDLDGDNDFSDASGPEVALAFIAPSGNDERLIRCRITNDAGGVATGVVEVKVYDLSPTATLRGPSHLAFEQQGLFRLRYESPCDAIAQVEWKVDGVAYDPAPFTTIGSDAVDRRIAWDAGDPNSPHTVEVIVTDADGFTASAMVSVNVSGQMPLYAPRTNELIGETRRHTYRPLDQAIDIVRHRAQMRVRNSGEGVIPGPVYLTFSSLHPTGTALIDEAGAGPSSPSVEVIGEGESLDVDAYTDWRWVEWDVATDETVEFEFVGAPQAMQLSPYFATLPITTAVEGVSYVYASVAIDPDGEAVTYSLADAPLPPTGLTVDVTSGRVTWRPDQRAADEPDYAYRLIAQDSFGAPIAEQLVELTVIAANVPPVFRSEPETEAVAGQPYTYPIDANDADGDPPMLSLMDGPGAMYIDMNDTLVWDSPIEGESWVDIRATDTAGASSQQAYRLRVSSCATPVQMQTPTGEMAIEGLPYHKQVTVDNAASFEGIYYFLDIAPDGMTIDPNHGLIQWRPSFSDHGLRTVRVLVSDSPDGEGCALTRAFQVNVADRNGPPTAHAIAAPAAVEGVAYTLTLSGSDPDPDPITFDLIDPPAGMRVSPGTGRFTWAPSQTAAADSPHLVEFEVRDSVGQYDRETFMIDVIEVDAAPRFRTTPPTTTYEGETYTYRVKAIDDDNPADPNGDLLTYQLLRGPVGMSLTNRVLTWNVVAGASSDSPQTVVLSVSDGAHTREQSWDLRIAGRPTPLAPNDPPVITFTPPPPHLAFPGQTYSYPLQVSDDDDLQFETDSLESLIPDGLMVDSAGVVTWQPDANQISDDPYWVRIIVDDQHGNRALVRWNVYVVEPNESRPVILSEPPLRAEVGQPYRYHLVAADDPADSLTYALIAAPMDGVDEGRLVGAPVGMALTAEPNESANDRKRLITWTPTEADIGVVWYRVQVTDGTSSQTQTVPVSVTSGGLENTPPTIPPFGPLGVRTGNALDFLTPVIDPDAGDAHVFELVGPHGMEIGRTNGLIHWEPAASQLGQHAIRVRVTDRGGAAFEIDARVYVLEPNMTAEPPSIVTAPVRSATSSTTYEYDVDFIDSDIGDTHSVFLPLAPAGMTVDPTSGLISWPTSAADEGTHSVTVRVTDRFGLFDEQSYQLTVSSDGGNRPPVFRSRPAPTATIGALYEYALSGFDPDGDSFNFTLREKPAGTSVDPNTQVVTWTPAISQNGRSWFTIRVTDTHGAWTEQRFDVTASLEGENHAPTIVSRPIDRVAAGQVYVYRARATDPDPADRVTYSLDDALAGMEVRASTGEVRWETEGFAAGVYQAVLRASDSSGASDTQLMRIAVSTVGRNAPPAILSQAPNRASSAVSSVYSYSPVAVDDGDPNQLTWTLRNDPAPPAGMTIDPNRGHVTWSTEGVAPGTYSAIIHVQDPNLAWDEQTLHVTISPDGTNRAPRIVSAPIRHVPIGTTYAYMPMAIDEDGDPLVWTRLEGPNDLTFNSMEARFEWPTTGVSPGAYAVTIQVADPNGTDTQRFVIEVSANQPPAFASAPVVRAIEDVTYRYDVDAVDTDDLSLHYRFMQVAGVPVAPDGMTIDPDSGEIEWTPDANDVNKWHPVHVQVTDESNNVASQDFRVFVVSREVGDALAPFIQLSVSAERVAIGSQTTLTVNVSDDTTAAGQIVVRRKVDNGPFVTMSNNNGVATYTYTAASGLPAGKRIFRVSATDQAGRVATEEISVAVYDSGQSDSAMPSVRLLAPDPNARTLTEVEDRLTIRGWVFDTNLYKYDVVYRPVSAPTQAPVVVFTGYDNVRPPADLAELDATLMENGLYEVFIVAEDLYGNTHSTRPAIISVTGQQKVGAFTLTFSDLQTQVAGLPIAISRSYDSRDQSHGAFGVGWQFDLATLRIEETTDLGQYWAYQGDFYSGCASYPTAFHGVNLVWPDGRAETFEFVPNIIQQGVVDGGACLIGEIDGVQFVRMSPGTSRLSLVGSTPLQALPEYQLLGFRR